MILPLYSSCHHVAAMATCTMLQNKRANFLVFDIFCYIGKHTKRVYFGFKGVDTK